IFFFILLSSLLKFLMIKKLIQRLVSIIILSALLAMPLSSHEFNFFVYFVHGNCPFLASLFGNQLLKGLIGILVLDCSQIQTCQFFDNSFGLGIHNVYAYSFHNQIYNSNLTCSAYGPIVNVKPKALAGIRSASLSHENVI